MKCTGEKCPIPELTKDATACTAHDCKHRTPPMPEKSCNTCKYYAELKTPFERSDGAVIYGYCFKDGDKDYSPNMGKGYAVFVDGGGCACKQHKRKKGSAANA